jgi:predicted glutamine amidotransferase
MTWPEFLAAWDCVDEKHVTALLHFRIATHGTISEDNTHPFPVFQSQLVMAHNGILTGFGGKDKSDTLDFVDTVISKLARDFVTNPAAQILLRHAIGHGNKLAFLSNLGDLTLVNEKAGEWKGGIWYSNNSYKPFVRTTRLGILDLETEEFEEYWRDKYHQYDQRALTSTTSTVATRSDSVQVIVRSEDGQKETVDLDADVYESWEAYCKDQGIDEHADYHCQRCGTSHLEGQSAYIGDSAACPVCFNVDLLTIAEEFYDYAFGPQWTEDDDDEKGKTNA